VRVADHLHTRDVEPPKATGYPRTIVVGLCLVGVVAPKVPPGGNGPQAAAVEWHPSVPLTMRSKPVLPHVAHHARCKLVDRALAALVPQEPPPPTFLLPLLRVLRRGACDSVAMHLEDTERSSRETLPLLM